MKIAVSIVAAMLLAPSIQAQTKPAESKPAAQKSSKAFRTINPDTMAKPVSVYSQAVEVTGGKIVYIAGQVAIDRNGTLVGKDDFRAQAQQVFENLKLAVEAAGGDFTDIIKLNYFCSEAVDPALVPAVREVRDKYIDASRPPASTFVVVKRLVRPEWLLEVEAVAVINKK